jgi:hypothetical protein
MAKGETIKVKVWARRVWTLELSLVSRGIVARKDIKFADAKI